jgi:hypothetical protein
MKISLKTFLCLLMALLLTGTFTKATSAPLHLTNSIPECRMPPGKVLPEKYYKFKKDKKAFDWVAKVTKGNRVVSGAGYERVDDSDMHDWFTFYLIDLNGDGLCDWYLNASAPFSTGGDRGTINTLYIGTSSGWARIGATVPDNKPDSLGTGMTDQQQKKFLYGEYPSVILETSTKTRYIITALYNRNVDQDFMPGYRIFVWDADKKSLRLLNKWEPGSKAAEVYAFFKVHGAAAPFKRSAGGDAIIRDYDPDVETFELEQVCNPDGTLRSSNEPESVVSKYLLIQCKKYQRAEN